MNYQPLEKEETSEKEWIFEPSLFISPLLISTASSFVIVFFLTNIIEFIARQDPTWINIKILWPPVLYLGAIIGGMIGTGISYIEFKLWQKGNYEITPGRIASSDLIYTIMVFIMIYFLEVISESLILQGIMYLCEIGFFVVFSRNISKLLLDNPKNGTNDDTKASL